MENAIIFSQLIYSAKGNHDQSALGINSGFTILTIFPFM